VFAPLGAQNNAARPRSYSAHNDRHIQLPIGLPDISDGAIDIVFPAAFVVRAIRNLPCAALFGDVYSAKPERLYYGVGVTHGVPAVQNLTDVSAMDAVTVCKCSMTPITFKCRFQQNKCVVVVKYMCGPAQTEASPISSFFVRLSAMFLH